MCWEYGARGWRRGDVIGAGVSADGTKVFFTRNGVALGPAFDVETQGAPDLVSVEAAVAWGWVGGVWMAACRAQLVVRRLSRWCVWRLVAPCCGHTWQCCCRLRPGIESPGVSDDVRMFTPLSASLSFLFPLCGGGVLQESTLLPFAR